MAEQVYFGSRVFKNPAIYTIISKASGSSQELPWVTVVKETKKTQDCNLNLQSNVHDQPTQLHGLVVLKHQNNDDTVIYTHFFE